MKAICLQVGDISVVRISGKLELGQVVWLRNIFHELDERNYPKILLDFKDVQEIDNACIYELKAFQELEQNKGKQLTLLHAGSVKGFSLTMLVDFEVFDDEAKAFTSFD